MQNQFPWLRGVVMVILAVLLILPAGLLCLVDRDGDRTGDEMMDMCHALVAAIAAIDLIVVTVVTSGLVPTVVQSYWAVSPHLPDPPPKSPLLV